VTNCAPSHESGQLLADCSLCCWPAEPLGSADLDNRILKQKIAREFSLGPGGRGELVLGVVLFLCFGERRGRYASATKRQILKTTLMSQRQSRLNPGAFGQSTGDFEHAFH
jgi:hypothetical protein